MSTMTPTRRARIIIADDESLIRMDLREMLGHLGYEVVAEASDGPSAVRLAKKLLPDLSTSVARLKLARTVSRSLPASGVEHGFRI